MADNRPSSSCNGSLPLPQLSSLLMPVALHFPVSSLDARFSGDDYLYQVLTEAVEIAERIKIDFHADGSVVVRENVRDNGPTTSGSDRDIGNGPTTLGSDRCCRDNNAAQQ